MTTDEETPSHAELVDRARALQPLLARHAGDGEINRRQAAEVIDALTHAGMFRLLSPRRFGGYLVSLRTLVDVTEALAVADGSAAWVVGLSAGVSWSVGHATEQAQDEIFGMNQDARFSGNGEPARGRRIGGGVLLSGRWPYVSGSPHADWAGIGVAVDDGDGVDVPHFALVPAPDLSLEDTWHTVGMRGTGSHTWAGEDVFVPEHRLISVRDISECSPTHPEPVHRLPIGVVALFTILGALPGFGQAALDHVIEKASSKGIQHTVFARRSDSVAVQVRIAEAALKVDSARLHVQRAADEIDAAAQDTSTLDYAARARTRAAAGYATQQVLEAIQQLLDVHGAGSFSESDPLQRIWRDANVAGRHAGLNAAVGYEVFGKSLLGIQERIAMV